MYQEAVGLLRPTILVARVCGVCPSALRQVFIPTTNKVYAVVLALCPVLCFKFTVLHLSYNFNDITFVSFVFIWSTFFLGHWVMLVMSFVQNEGLIKFFAIMESVQEALFSLNIRQPHTPSTTSQICWILFFTLPFHYVVSVNIYTRSPMWGLLQVALVLVRSGTMCKLRVMLDLVNDKFDLLNWHLDDLNNRWPLFLPRPPDVTFSELACVASWRRSKFVQYDQNVRQVSASKIRSFNKAHLYLCLAYKTLNSVFSLIGLALSVIIGSNAIVGVITVFMKKQTNAFSVFAWSAQILNDVSSFIVILAYTTSINKRAQKAALLVHDLLDEEGHSAEVLDELENFSTALLHRKATFSCAGLFDLDLKLVTRMASMLAPIILFLIQNDNRPRAGRNKRPS